MDWIYALAAIIAIVVIAFLLGWTEKNVRSRAAKASIWIGSILLLLALRFGFTGTWEFCLLLLALSWRMLDHIPPFIGWVILGSIVYLFYEYRFRVTAAAVLEVLAEVEKTNARIELLENSVRDKLHDIRIRLPEQD